MGYMYWEHVEQKFIAPDDAVSVTIFFAATGKNSCNGGELNSTCVGPNYGQLSIANVVLTQDDTEPTLPPDPNAETSMIHNPSFEILGENGDPVEWLRGGYGNNTPTFSVIDYPPIPPDSTYCGLYVYQNPDGEKSARVGITNYVDGDAKWYFSDIPVGNEKTFRLQHWYRSNVATELSARYLLNDGSYLYQKIADLEHTGGGACMGTFYTRKTENVFIAPDNAVSMTLFHSLSSNGWLETDNFILTN